MHRTKERLRIRGLEMPVDLPDLSELEKSALIQFVEERFDQVEVATNGKVVDTARLALLTALSFADELQRLKSQSETSHRMEENKIDNLIATLRNAIDE